MSHITQHIKTKRSITITGISAIFILLLLTLSTLLPLDWSENITEAVTGSATLSETSLTMTSSSTTASVDLSVLKDNGTFASSANPIKFEVKTSNYSGYTISLSGSSNKLTNTTANGSYANDSDKYATLSSISTSIDTNTFKADSDASTTYNGKFGISPSKYKSGNTIVNNTSDNATYLPAPTSAITLDETTSANSGANSYTIGLGARASYTQAAGTYVGTYKLTAVGNPINYVLTYDKNTTDTVADVPNNKSDSTSQTTITLDSTVPTRDGYTFLGWCLGTITTTNNADSCTGATYQPGASFGIDQTTENKPTLKAMWEKDALTMQSMTSGDCLSSEPIEIEDVRDSSTYNIQRLADGKCWMLDNLTLNLVDPEIQVNLSSFTTNASDVELAYLKNGGGTTTDKYATSGVIDWPTNSNSFSVPYVNISSKDKVASGGYANGKIGAYYNYCAVSAGAYCFGDGNNYGSPFGNNYADICPRGWRLPTGANGGEFETLYHAYNDDYANFVQALRTPLAGSYSSGHNNDQGVRGDYWTSKYSNQWGMGALSISSATASPSNSIVSTNGVSVRCVFNDYPAMQDLTKDAIASLLPANGSQAIAYDKRDGQNYIIARLADGEYWMTKNLNLHGTYGVITDADSDVASKYSLPWSSDSGFSGNSAERMYYSGSATCSTKSQCYSYYTWVAATAGSGANITRKDIDAPYSICPKGWKLPKSRSTTTSVSQFYNLATLYGMDASNTYQLTANFYNLAGPGTIPNFSLAGHFSGSTFSDGGAGGNYWSSTAGGKDTAYNLSFRQSQIYSNNNSDRGYGFSVRCVFAG